ncbi:phosphate-starvation-inducible protein PsiE [Carnobacterium divergens]|nr:phosphate-starvation-inducible protein PsiE [Carnobacterium divergens]
MIIMEHEQNKLTLKIAKGLRFILNISLSILGLVLAYCIAKEVVYIFLMIAKSGFNDYYVLIQEVLVFFLYFEFISLVVKYFESNYHFPLDYFIYIGITAIVRIIITDHGSPWDTLILACAIVVLLIALVIVNRHSLDDKS